MTDRGDAYTRFSDAVDGPMTVLAVVWLPVLVIPLLVHLSPGLDDTFNTVDYVVWALFALEYLIKLGLAPDRRRFVRTHLLDLVVIVIPFLRPLRALRAMRLLRLTRAGSLAGDVLARAKRILTAHSLHYVLLAALMLIFAAAAAELGFEAHAVGSNIHTYGQALWWAIVTVTTVGYGDRYPVTPAGQGVAVFLMLVGIGLVGIITANIASYFVSRDDTETAADVESRMDRIEQLLTLIAEANNIDLTAVAQPKDPPGK